MAPAKTGATPQHSSTEKDTLMLSGFTQLFNNLTLFGGDLLGLHIGF
ncbi:hypothetical protein ACWDOP_27590 [Nocardia sp. NPDC003693]